MVNCTRCNRNAEDSVTAIEKGWTPYWQDVSATEDYVCMDCQEELLFKLSEPDNTPGIEALTALFGNNHEGEVFFAGNWSKDDPRSIEIMIKVGDYEAHDTIYERDIEKFQTQAAYYSGGNIARFILDVFNKFVDRYET